MITLLAFSFLAGIFTALSPCVLPVLPAILAAGVTKERLRPLGTIIGLICSFSFFTLTLNWLIHKTGISPQVLRYGAIALILFFGLVLLFPRLSNWFAKITTPIADLGQKIQPTRSGFWGGFIFGLALGLLWTPCAGPILAAITTLVATQAITLTAVFMTLAYSVGAGIPLFLFAYGSTRILEASHFLSRYSERIRQVFGVLMILFGVLLTLNWDMLLTEKLAQLVPDLFLEKTLPVEKELEKITGQKSSLLDEPAPPLTGITAWINSPPLELSELRGKVVLIDFWTYSCINCLRTLPYLKNWYHDYEKYGFVIIGVHTPEFAFEKDLTNVQEAVKRLGILYPVALDNEYATWKAYHNHYWPAHYLVDQTGIIRMVHFGEGAYEETENAIRMLLGLVPIEMKGAKEKHREITPETYLGMARGKSYAQPLTLNQIENYQYTPPLKKDQVGLRGLWLAEREYIVSESDDSYLDGNFLATHIYLVLAGSSQTPLEIFLGGKLFHSLLINEDKEYEIVSTTYQRHQLSLKIPKGIKAYVFTFGGN